MLTAPILTKNPTLYVFLPIYYAVWSDAVLTPTEISTIESLLTKQEWLSKQEKEFLLAQLDPTSPPSPDELKAWLAEIQKVANQESADKKLGLVEIGLALANLHNSKNGISTKAKESLHEIEDVLGLISSESTFLFNAAKRKTITESQVTKSSFDINTMAALLDGQYADIIKKVKTITSDPAFQYIDTDNLNERREKVLEWCKLLAKQGFGSMAFPKEYGGGGSMGNYFAIMETLSYHDLSMVIKFGVQFGLWGMSIYFLGTEKHHKKYLKDIGTLELPGCFAMTETGHGSNVKGILTTATYDHTDKTFTIHTPNESARKEYIGNAALHGQVATTFAKLIIDGQDYGVSAFVVPLRDKQGNLHPGVTIKDCGRKMGLNGVDNGVIYFDHVRIPKDDMLDRFAGVDDNGKFTSPIASDNRRFFTMLGTLVG
ncbi:MAG TPA: acyl-CoA dehydrogenase family protein, partial [Cyclobacteriaceae bacterium]